MIIGTFTKSDQGYQGNVTTLNAAVRCSIRLKSRRSAAR